MDATIPALGGVAFFIGQVFAGESEAWIIRLPLLKIALVE